MDESLSNVLRLRTLFLVTFLALFEVTSLIIASASAPLRTDSQADVLIAGGASLSAVAQWPAISEQQVAPAEIDFTVLHRQASDALDNLRRSQQRRAPTSPAAF